MPNEQTKRRRQRLEGITIDFDYVVLRADGTEQTRHLQIALTKELERALAFYAIHLGRLFAHRGHETYETAFRLTEKYRHNFEQALLENIA